MCACEPGYVCSRCSGDPFARESQDARPVTEADFDVMTRTESIDLAMERFLGHIVTELTWP